MDKTYIKKDEIVGIDRDSIGLEEEVREFCRVCCKPYYFDTYRTILLEDTILVDDIYYLVPSTHDSCVELFHLNPLVYLIDG